MQIYFKILSRYFRVRVSLLNILTTQFFEFMQIICRNISNNSSDCKKNNNIENNCKYSYKNRNISTYTNLYVKLPR